MFHAACNNDIRLLRSNGLARKRYRLQPGTANFVDRESRDIFRETGTNRGLPRGVLSQAGLENISHDHFVDVISGYQSFSREFLDNGGSKVYGIQRGKGAVEPPYCCPYSTNDIRFHTCSFRVVPRLGNARARATGYERRPVNRDQILMPPSTSRMRPVKKSFSMMNWMAWAISSISPSLPRGIFCTTFSRISGLILATISVLMYPGAIAPTRMPNFASSLAQVTVMESTADFEAE